MTAPLLPTPVARNLEAQIKASKSKVRLEDFVNDLTGAFGGSRQIADKMVREFDDGKPGSLSRAKILDCYTRLLSLCSKKEETAPVSELTDEQLVARAIEFGEKALKAVPIMEAQNGPQSS